MHTVLPRFAEFFNPPHPLRFIKTPRRFFEIKLPVQHKIQHSLCHKKEKGKEKPRQLAMDKT